MLRRRVSLVPGLVLAVCACSAEPADAPDNLVVITLDTLRRDHLGCYGYFRDTSPHIDELARESLVFDACRAPVSQTLPTHTSLFTGLSPYEHGIEANLNQTQGRYVPSPHLRTLATWLGGEGYATAAFVSAEPVKRESGLAAGFELWDEPQGAARRADETIDRALAWLLSRDAGPFHLWVHLFDPHLPYDPPPPFDGHFQADARQEAYMGERQFLEILKPSRWRTEQQPTRLQHDLYDGEVLFSDLHLGRLLQALRADRAWSRTVVVFTSDHGEGLGQHYLMGHESVWAEQLDVPLLVRAPSLAPDRDGTALTSRDVLPTVLPLLRGLDPSGFLAQSTGTSVLVAPRAAPRATFSQNPGSYPKRVESITLDDWRLIVGMAKRDLLFHLAEDPHELRSVAKRHAAKAAELKALLRAQRARQEGVRERLEAGRLAPASEARRAGLESLGYAGDGE